MKILEFGKKGKPVMLLIHGFQSPWQVWEKYIEHYKWDFHIVVPVLTGHDPDCKEDFISFDDEQDIIEEFIIDNTGEGSVHTAFAMSMGGVLAAKLWQDGVIGIEKLVFDGSPLVSVNGLTAGFMHKFYLNVTQKVRDHDQKIIRQAEGTIISEECLAEFVRVVENMTDRTVINCINAIAEYRLKTDADTSETKIYYFHGTAQNEMLAKKTAKFLKKYYPDTMVKCFKGKAHCESSLIHPEIMISELDGIIQI